jgi:GTPase SAR1 family protein
MRIQWDKNYESADIIFYIIDSSDFSRISEARREYTRILADPQLKDKPIFLLFHKIDIFEAQTNIEVIHHQFEIKKDRQSLFTFDTSINKPGTIEPLIDSLVKIL